MAALQAARLTKERLTPKGRRFAVAAAVAIWQGAIVALKTASGSTYAQGATTATGLTVVGIAGGTADNRTGAAGALSVDVQTGVFLLDIDGSDPVTLANIGATVYATDDHTIAATNGSNTKSAVGTLFDIDAASGGAWVKIS